MGREVRRRASSLRLDRWPPSFRILVFAASDAPILFTAARNMVASHKRNELVLIASDGEWFARSLESVLELNGYAVQRSMGGSKAIEAAHEVHPDAILLDDAQSDVSTVGVCRSLRDDPSFDHSTPIIITSSAPAAHRGRTDAFAAGAWDYCGQPLDIEALLLKLATFIRARREMLMAQALTDPITGLYSPLGLEQWAKKLGAWR